KKDERLIELLSHIISAQKIWLNRTLQRDISLNPWEKHTVQECFSQSTIITAEWINLLESFKANDLERRIDYKNTKGEKFSNTVKDIVTHVINHSTYHRAQIAQRLKALGGKPAVTDYIFYQRQFQN
ncbi:MAG TPA: DinB family protein, partial [Ignavibacteriaceae bacterium]